MSGDTRWGDVRPEDDTPAISILPPEIMQLIEDFGGACEWAGRDHISDETAGLLKARAALEAAIIEYGKLAEPSEERRTL